MADVTIYTTKLCGYCYAAKRLLKQKGVSYREVDVTFSRTRRADMLSRSGGRHTTPQIFIGEQHVGGCDDLYALDQTGKLDGLLEI